MFTRRWTEGTVGSAGQVMSLANLRLHAIKIYVTNGMVAALRSYCINCLFWFRPQNRMKRLNNGGWLFASETTLAIVGNVTRIASEKVHNIWAKDADGRCEVGVRLHNILCHVSRHYRYSESMIPTSHACSDKLGKRGENN